MKVKKVNVLICLALSMVLLFSPAFVSAENLEYVDVDSPYCVIEDSPTAISMYAAEPMSYTRMTYYSYQNTPDGDYYQNGNYALGQRITSYYPDYVEIFIINDDGVLFSNAGSLSLLLFVHGNELTITTYFEGGGSKEYVLDPKSYDGVISLIIDNVEANIKSLRIRVEDHNPGQYTTPTSVLSLDAFAYEIKEYTLFDIISDFFNNFFADLKTSFRSVLNSFFGDTDNTYLFGYANMQLDSLQEELVSGNVKFVDIDLHSEIFENAELLASMAWISGILAGLFANIRFSVVFYIICTFTIVCISLGFARHWKG